MTEYDRSRQAWADVTGIDNRCRYTWEQKGNPDSD